MKVGFLFHSENNKHMHTESRTSPVVFRTGKRIYLRPLQKEDALLLTLWINDPEVHQFLTTFKPVTVEDEYDWFEEVRKDKNSAVFIITFKDTNEPIGVMGLHQINNLHGTATTGSFIGRKDCWSKGYGTEAKMLVLEYAFNTRNLRKVCSKVFDFNGRSKRALEKCGYKVEGVLKKHHYRNGRYCDCIQLAVFKKDFLPLWRKFKKELS